MKNLLLTLVCSIILLSCTREQPKAPIQAPAREQAPKTEKNIKVPEFNAQKAYEYLLAQTNFGPRHVGSQGHILCLDYLKAELKKYADTVWLQPFSRKGYENTMLNMTNVFASFNQRAQKRILLLAHWDTRPWADQEADPSKHNQPILGANDGASGVAVLLEIARILHDARPPVGVDILFVDGEDYGKEGDGDNYLLGSRYFAHHKPNNYSPMFGILLDMIGDSQLEIKRERFSLQYAPDIVDMVWSTAQSLGVTQFTDIIEKNVGSDDHIPLNQAGIKTIDLIDFSYPYQGVNYWHTLEDTPDKCSPESLGAVGVVLLHVIFNQTP